MIRVDGPGDASCPGVWSCHSWGCKILFFSWLRRRSENGRRILGAFSARCVSRMVGLGFQAIENSIGPPNPGIAGRNRASLNAVHLGP